MTEAASQIAANPLERRKPGSVGKSCRSRDRDHGPAGPKATGRRTWRDRASRATITQGGYDNDITATESAFRNGWFRYGDLGTGSGRNISLSLVVSRTLFNRGGQQVSPVEVEEALLRPPGRARCGARSQFRIKNWARMSLPLSCCDRIPRSSTHKLREFARKRLAAYKVPGLIRIVPEIPKGASGKIKRGALADALLTRHGEEKMTRHQYPGEPAFNGFSWMPTRSCGTAITFSRT